MPNISMQYKSYCISIIYFSHLLSELQLSTPVDALKLVFEGSMFAVSFTAQ